MKQRFFYLLKIFAVFIAFFALCKPFFLLYNAPEGSHYTLAQTLQAIWHGLNMDASMTGYLLIVPFLLVWISVWLSKISYKIPLAVWLVLCSLVVAAIAVADVSLYAFWEFKIDATIFFYLDTPSKAVASVSTGYVVVRCAVALLLAAALSWVCIKLTPRHFVKIEGKMPMIWANIAIIVLGGMLFLAIRGGIGRSTMNVGNAFWCNDQLLNQTAINPSFSLFSSINKQKDFKKEYRLLPADECARTFAQLYPSMCTDSTDVELLNTQRPNILIIEFEGYGGEFIEALGGIEDVSPNWNRLIKEGVFFSNFYANSFRTDRGTVSALSGHISYPSTSIMKLPTKLMHLPSLARTLVKAGYTTDFLYGGDVNFTNTKGYLLNMGYQRITSDVDFSEAERHTNAWGVNDDITFDWLFRQITARPSDKLWHTTFLTLSSHEPFIVPYHRLKDERLNAFAYTDHCFGTFIEKLRQTPAWKNLLIVCLPDHGFRYRTTTNDPRFYHVPMLWLGGAVKAPHTVDVLMNQSDMAATLLGQLGLPHNDFPYSRNVLSPGYTYPFVYSTAGNFLFADSTGVTVFDLSARRPIYDHPAPSPDRVRKGEAILQHTYDELGNW